MYTYLARLVKVVDGDTIDIDISLGFRITIMQRCRLRGINTPETRGASREAGLKASEFTKAWLAGVEQLTIHSFKPYGDDKFGRFLVQVFKTPTEPSLNDALLASGNAVPFMVD